MSDSPAQNCSKLYAFLGLNCRSVAEDLYGPESGADTEIRCDRKGNPEVVVTRLPKRRGEPMANMLNFEKAVIVENYLANADTLGKSFQYATDSDDFDFGFDSPAELAQEDSEPDCEQLIINSDSLPAPSPSRSDNSMDSDTVRDSDEEPTFFCENGSPNGSPRIPELISANDVEMSELEISSGGDVTPGRTAVSPFCPRERTNGSAPQCYVRKGLPTKIYRFVEKKSDTNDFRKTSDVDNNCRKMYISGESSLEELKDAMQNLRLAFERRDSESEQEKASILENCSLEQPVDETEQSSRETNLDIRDDSEEPTIQHTCPVPELVTPSPLDRPPETVEYASCGDSGISGDDDRNSSISDLSDDEGRTRLRRSSSLRTGKTPPGTPFRKKIVRFADVMGLDLADVRTFLAGVPTIPKSAYQDLDVKLDSSDENLAIDSVLVREEPQKLVANFAQPGTLPGFIEKVKTRRVCLESAEIHKTFTLKGVIRLLNISFYKSVAVRYTTNEWNSFREIPATYVSDSCDGLTDKFEFAFDLPQMRSGERVQFAICYRVAGQEFWDNNCNFNYSFTCVSSFLSPACQQALLSPMVGDRAWIAFLN